MIAVGGQACRTVENANFYIDKWASFEACNKALPDRIIEDPTDETIRERLKEVPADSNVEVYASMQGEYSLTTVPKILKLLRSRGLSADLKLTLIPEDIRKYIGAPQISGARLGAAPKIFVSYAWEDEQSVNWVHELCRRLSKDGIDVILDSWSTELGDNLPQFMEDSIRNSDFVLFICTPRYKRKADSREGGVGFEGHIISGEAFVLGKHRKYIPILRLGDWPEAAPSWALGKLYADLRGDPYDENCYARLLRALHRADGAANFG